MDAPKSSLQVAVLRFLLALTILGALLVLTPNLIRIPYRISITYNEGWNLYHGTQVARGETLYDPARPLLPVNYPPLYFYLEAAMGKASGDMLFAGRWISAASLLLLAVFAGRAVRMLGGGWPDAVLAAALFAGYAGAYVPQYVGMNDPQMLAHVFMFGGFLILLKDRTAVRRLLAASCLMACGLFLKHNLLAIPMAAAAGLLVESRRRARLFTLFLASLIALLTLGTLWLAGGDFAHQILWPRTVSLSKLLEDTRHFFTFMAVPFVAAVVWMKNRFSRNTSSYLSFYLIFSLLIGIVASSGFGTAANMFLDSCLALAVTSGLLLADLRITALKQAFAVWLPALAVLALAINFLIEAPGSLRGLLSGSAVAHLQQREKIFLEDVAFLSQKPGPALCETLTLCFYAGKPMELDPFNISQAIVTGALNEQPIVELIQSGHFSTVQFKGQRTPDSSQTFHSDSPEIFADSFFTTNMIATIRERYDLQRKTQTGMFYTLR